MTMKLFLLVEIAFQKELDLFLRSIPLPNENCTASVGEDRVITDIKHWLDPERSLISLPFGWI